MAGPGCGAPGSWLGREGTAAASVQPQQGPQVGQELQRKWAWAWLNGVALALHGRSIRSRSAPPCSAIARMASAPGLTDYFRATPRRGAVGAGPVCSGIPARVARRCSVGKAAVSIERAGMKGLDANARGSAPALAAAGPGSAQPVEVPAALESQARRQPHGAGLGRVHMPVGHHAWLARQARFVELGHLVAPAVQQIEDVDRKRGLVRQHAGGAQVAREAGARAHRPVFAQRCRTHAAQAQRA